MSADQFSTALIILFLADMLISLVLVRRIEKLEDFRRKIETGAS